MTAHNTDDLIRAFVAEGREELPDRAFDAVRGEIHQTRQRVVIGPWRLPDMSNLTRVALVAAAVVAVVIGAIRLLPSTSGPGGQEPTPTPAPSSTPAPSPAATPRQAFANHGPLDAGTYRYDGAANSYLTDPATFFTFTVPAGWASHADESVLKHATAPDELDFEAWDVTHVFKDACNWNSDRMPSAGATAADLANVLASQTGRIASPVTDVVVDGTPAKRIELTNDPSIDVTTCSEGAYRLWPGAGPDLSGGQCCFTKGAIDQFTVVDRDGHHVVIIARHQPGSSAADVAELNAVVDSIRWISPGASAAP
jgi:hypothetical protein